ncbi:MAG: hypothetical protein R3228_16290, partial [Halioglobus sp.]|nr:hypothetical protein [Halioglobus sp.]
MSTRQGRPQQQRGAIGKGLLALLAVVAAGAVWLLLDGDAGKELKKQAQLKTMEVIGEAAANRLDFGEQGEGTHGSA